MLARDARWTACARSRSQSVRADHQVQVAQQLTFAFEHGAELPILSSRLGIPGEDCHPPQEFLDEGA